MPMKKKTSATENGTTGKAKQIGRYIVADPKICHGALTFRGTRVFVSDILEQVELGLPFEMIVKEWGGSVSLEAIHEALKLARETFVKHADEYSPPEGRRRVG